MSEADLSPALTHHAICWRAGADMRRGGSNIPKRNEGSASAMPSSGDRRALADRPILPSRVPRSRANAHSLGSGAASGNRDDGRVRQRFEVIILGGGMSGLALAAALGSVGRSVLVVERVPLDRFSAAPMTAGSQRWPAAACGSWTRSAHGRAWPRPPSRSCDIVVREGFSPIQVHYDHRAVGSGPLGHIVENRAIRAALLTRVGACRA